MKKLLIPLLVLTMIFSLSICAFAETVESPTADVVYDVTVNQPNKNAGSVTRVDNADGTITLTVSAAEAATFTKWALEGDYEIVSGSLTDTTITIRPKADNVVVNTVFANVDVTPTAPEDTDGDNDSDTSPETGAPVAAVAVTLAVALGAAFVAKKQLSK